MFSSKSVVVILVAGTAVALAPSGARAEAVDWSGFYVGLHGGYNWSAAKDFTSNTKLKHNEFSLGLHGGYNWQFDNMVMGIETDFQPLGFSKRKTGPIAGLRTAFAPVSSTRLRFGVAMDKALVYATTGVSLGIGYAKSGGRNSARLAAGLAFGGGLEYSFAPKWSLRGEYLAQVYNAKDRYNVAPATRRIKYRRTHSIRIGVSRRF